MLTYSTYQTALSTLSGIPTSDPNFIAILPNVIDYAEGRITRELDMKNADIRDATGSCIANSRNFNLPTSIGTFLIVDGINIITPAATSADSGVRNPLTPASRDMLDVIWPSASGATVPQYFSFISQAATQTQIIFGPWPDQGYTVEVCGKFQPQALSATNTTTWLSTYLPDLFLAASMVFFTGYLKNFSAQSDDPRMAVSWESQYQALKASAEVFEARKRFSGASWTSKQLEPAAQPQRG
jgi:hypothetical protein